MNSLLEYDLQGLSKAAFLIGIDEAGRGALAGPVVACGVKIEQKFYHHFREDPHVLRVKDSKLLSAPIREEIAQKAFYWKEEGWIDFSIQEGSVLEIETHNILGATKLAMQRAIQKLEIESVIDEVLPLFSNPNQGKIWIDGPFLKNFPYPHEGIVKGDQKSFVIALASILAKCTRDALMHSLDPENRYCFSQHKGYGTALHTAKLLEHGASLHHRKKFIASILKSNAFEPAAPLSPTAQGPE